VNRKDRPLPLPHRGQVRRRSCRGARRLQSRNGRLRSPRRWAPRCPAAAWDWRRSPCARGPCPPRCSVPRGKRARADPPACGAARGLLHRRGSRRSRCRRCPPPRRAARGLRSCPRSRRGRQNHRGPRPNRRSCPADSGQTPCPPRGDPPGRPPGSRRCTRKAAPTRNTRRAQGSAARREPCLKNPSTQRRL
jgi:hypothetical protein